MPENDKILDMTSGRSSHLREENASMKDNSLKGRRCIEVDSPGVTAVDGADVNLAEGALLASKEVASNLHVSRTKVYRMAKKEKIPAIRVGASLRFDYQEVLAALRQTSQDL